jgi:beta-lactamase superfamily II metal-dependent hydrolase
MNSSSLSSSRIISCGLALLLALGLAGLGEAGLEIHCLNVGQGDCTLIISPTGGSLLFDAGENGNGSSVVVPYIQSLGLTALDYVCASHYHSDHIGGIDEVVNNLGIDSIRVAVYDRGWSYVTQSYQDYASAVASKRTTITDGQVIDLGGGVTINCVAVNGNGILSPPFDDQYDENDLCVALVLEYLDFRLFVAGDLSGVNSSYYNDIETSVAPEVGSVNVYRVDHHGSLSNSNVNLVSTLLPEVSVISLGDGNPYGHPQQDILDRLVTYGSYIYQTELGTGGTIPPGNGEVVDDHVVIEVEADYYTVDGTDIYELGGSGIPISDVNEDDQYGQPVLYGEPAMIRGIVTVGTGTFSSTNNDIFVEDATGGVNVFKASSMTPAVSVGDSVRVSGIVDLNFGLTRMSSPTIYIEVVGAGVRDTAQLTTAGIDTSGEYYEGSLVRVEGVTITGGTWPGEGSSGTLTIDDGSGECTIFIDKDTDIDGNPEPTTGIDIVGVVTQYDITFPYHSGYRLVPRSIDDIVPTAGISDLLHQASLISRVFPNPTRGRFRIVFSEQAVQSAKQIAIYDVAGRMVADTEVPAGNLFLDWNPIDANGRALASGIYFAETGIGDRSSAVKILLIR